MSDDNFRAWTVRGGAPVSKAKVEDYVRRYAEAKEAQFRLDLVAIILKADLSLDECLEMVRALYRQRSH